MTRKELRTLMYKVYARNWAHIDSEHQINHCQAWYYTDGDLQAVALRSYSLIVAIYWRGVVWKFSMTSNTTTQHICKFARLMDAPVVPLYRHSRMAINDYNICVASDWEDFISDVLKHT